MIRSSPLCRRMVTIACAPRHDPISPLVPHAHPEHAESARSHVQVLNRRPQRLYVLFQQADARVACAAQKAPYTRRTSVVTWAASVVMIDHLCLSDPAHVAPARIQVKHLLPPLRSNSVAASRIAGAPSLRRSLVLFRALLVVLCSASAVAR